MSVGAFFRIGVMGASRFVGARGSRKPPVTLRSPVTLPSEGLPRSAALWEDEVLGR